MKILATADWHIGNFRSPVKDGVNLRTEDTKRCLDELARVAGEEQPDYTLVSGDIFDAGKVWSDRCCEEIVTAARYINRLSMVSMEVVIMRGTPNHDGIGFYNVLSKMFADRPNVHIIATPQVIHFEDVDIAVLPGFDRGVYRAEHPGLSFEEENTVFVQELSNIVMGLKAQCSPDKKSILMAHYTVPGCNTESGQLMLLAKFEPVLPPEALRAAGYDLVALGHIHRPQKVPNVENCFYAGAINALNFNDENQERGFWIHTDTPLGGWESRFCKTPYREFISFEFTDTDITAINFGHIDEVAYNYWRYNGAVKDKIVRIRYTCSEKNRKAFNKTILERALLDDGAFMVWEILPDKIEEFANKTELAGASDPETNLVKYLEEKQVEQEKMQELVLKARPIIAEAEAGTKAAAHTGIFEPVEISVKNYRNYAEETFNFENISFCTINGQNGAGKSSLFMDAIIDCLFEEPREGIIKDDSKKAPWLRNDESARSGSIMFTFCIGGKKWRVTRTRARSGKGTLNIAQFIDGEWQDCSKERYNDTQQEIQDILGMDSFTFKSCALIMQDQYGLFLQAKPEERVKVLGTLLGLNMYQDMERIAAEKEKTHKSMAGKLADEIEIHTGTISSLGKPGEELEALEKELAACEASLKAKTAERDRQKLVLANRQEAAERREKLLTSITTLQSKKAATDQNRATQQTIIESSGIILNSRAEIEAKVAEYNSQIEREKQLAGESALYASKKRDAESFRQQADAEQKSIDSMRRKVSQKETELAALQPTERDAVIRSNAAEYEQSKKQLDEAYERERSYRELEQQLSDARHERAGVCSEYEYRLKGMGQKLAEYQKQAELLENVECVDIGNAKCGFLATAISAKNALGEYPGQIETMNAEYKAALVPYDEKISSLQAQLEGMENPNARVEELRQKCTELKPYVNKLAELNQRESKIALLEAGIGHLQSNIADAKKRLAEVKLKGAEAVQERDRYAEAFDEHVQVLNSIAMLEPWLEKEKQLPVEEERNLTAQKRLMELKAELDGIVAEISEKQKEADKELSAMGGMEELEGVVASMDAEVDSLNATVREKQMAVGALQQQEEQIAKLKQEIAALQEKLVEHAKEVADYEVLKTAFSQSGVPHQIIRSIIPKLTATANAILGQMTGGKMGVEFRLERMLKNGKEKVSLDIFIEEYGKPALPYLSKSGGEKVKSSLSVILALAEIKSSSAGIQLGFLQIDEPPFLDTDGTQAYVDALEAIQQRYQGLKVMAITHDKEFKARFPQAVEVYKDESGSHVRWDS
ncbi:MAG: AAA family ATPase [Lachnospiraceae bacterium]|nr:AAA family ATPase [Lachnospiraceae bacterium]